MLVGVLNRRPDLIVAFAILKAGGAYVPLDPAYPADRLAFLFEDAGMSLVLTERALRQKLSRPTTRFCVDGPLPAVEARSDGDCADPP